MSATPRSLPTPARRRPRLLAAMLGASLALQVLPVAVAGTAAPAWASPQARSIDRACPEGRTPRSNLSDVRGTAFEREVDCIAAYGLDTGISSEGRYRPTQQVTRAEMATFLANVLRAAGRSRPSDTPNAFRDDEHSPHRANIDWLAWEGIVRGRPDRTFGPEEPVSRAQLATFVNRVFEELTGRALRSEVDWFADDHGSLHEASINGLAGAGIVTGTAPDTYTPHGHSSRGHMAGFLARTLAELVERGHVTVPFGPREVTVSPTDGKALPTSNTSSSTTRDRGRREFTVTVPVDVDRVTIALFPSGQVSRGSDGRPLFTSNGVLGRSAGAGIELLDGRFLDQADGDRDVTQVDDVHVGDDGKVTFTIDADEILSVVPVVWVDRVNPSENRLDLPTDSANRPRAALEPVAVGGTTSWGPVEPARGQNLDTGTVRAVDPAGGFYLLDTGGDAAPDFKLRFTTQDDFTYTASREPVSNSPGPITHGQFVQWLSVGDRVNPSSYEPGNMRHTIVGDVPVAPTNVVAQAQSGGQVRITWTKPSNPVADDADSSFRLERAPTTGSSAGQFKEVASRSADRSPEFVDTPPSSGPWSYRVVARSVTGSSPATTAATVTSSSPAAPATTASRVVDNGAGGSGGANGVLDRGDRLEFTFDRAVDVAGGWSITVQDRDGTRAVLDNTNATPVLSSDGRGLVVHVGTAGPRPVRRGDDDAIDVSASSSGTSSGFLQVVAAAGIGRNGAWNLPASGIEGAPHHGSRTLLDGTGTGRRTPLAPSGHVVLVGGTSRLELGRDEVKTIRPTNAVGGTWRLRLGNDGPWSAELDHDATATEVLAALEGLATIGKDNVVVTGGPVDRADLVLAFTGALGAKDVDRLHVDASKLTAPGNASLVAPEVVVTTVGAVVHAVPRGARVQAFDEQGSPLGEAVAGTNGRTGVPLARPIAKGTKVLVVVEHDTGRSSATAVVTAA